MHTRIKLFAASMSIGALSTAAVAGPTGGVVVEGQGSISTPSAGTTIVDQGSHHLLLNWNTFNIGASESVRFNQPTSSSVAVNRILDQSPSQIFGSLSANGQVVLANPNGLLIGRTAQLNVNSLVVSSLDAIDFDAASGRYRFSASRNDIGSVINEGSITAGPGGSVTLLGGHVSNTGTILADFGTVNLAAGRKATLDLAGDGLLRLEVSNDLFENASGANAAVENSGTIQANGGQVLLTANAVQDVFANLVNNAGVVRANRIDNTGGVISLVGPEGIVRSSGTLDASAGDSISTGGTVKILGDKVGLFDHAVVDVSGATGGGTALIGGDYQGKNPGVLNAQRAYVSADSTINADAGTTGDGGKIIVWSDEYTRFDGNLSARGGTASGNGGFAEVSGKQSLAFNGGAKLTAPHGQKGTLLLDPETITIDISSTLPGDAADGEFEFDEDPDDATIGNNVIEDLLDNGDVILQAETSITQLANADIVATGSSPSSLTLQSNGTIALNADISTGAGNVTLTAFGDVNVSSIITSGTVSITSGSLLGTGDILHAPGGGMISANALILNADGSIGGTALGEQLRTNVSSINAHATNGSVNIHESNAVSLQNVTASGAGSNNIVVTNDAGAITLGTLSASDSIQITAASAINDDGLATVVQANALTLDAGTSIGSLGNRVDTQVGSLNASTNAGGIFISETDNIALNPVISTGGDVDILSGGIITAHVVSGTNVTLSADAIADDNVNTTRISGTTVTLTATAGSIGSPGAANIDTSADQLIANATNGDVYINELNAVTLTNISATGAGQDVSVTAGAGIPGPNDITVLNVSAADQIQINAPSGRILGPASNISGTGLTLTTLNDIGAAGTPLRTNVGTLGAVTTNGSLYVRELNDISLQSITLGGASVLEAVNDTGNITVGNIVAPIFVTLSAQGGSILDDGVAGTRIHTDGASLFATGSIGTGGGAVGTDVNTLFFANANNGSVFINELNGLTVSSVTAAGAGGDVAISSNTGNITVERITAADAVTLTATTGAIVDDVNDLSKIVAGSLSMTAGTSIGANGNEIDTTVASLSTTAHGGSVYVTETDGLTLTSGTAEGAGNDVVITSTVGDITVGAVSAADEARLNAVAGSILDDGNPGTRAAAGVLNLRAFNTIGVDGTPLGTDAGLLDAVSQTGSVFVSELNNLTLANVRAEAPAGRIGVTSTGGSLLVQTVLAADSVSLDAAAAITDDNSNGTGIVTGTLSLTAGTSIGGTGPADIDTDVGTLNATANNGSVFIRENNSVLLNTVSAFGAGSDVTVFNQGGNTTVGTINATDTVTLLNPAGSILDDGNDGTRIVANAAELHSVLALGGPGASESIDTNVALLTAQSDISGVHISELNDVQVGAIAAAGPVALTSMSGAITDDGNDATVISGAKVDLTAATAIGQGTITAAGNLTGSSLDVQTVGELTATVTSNSGQINLSISGNPILNAGAITLGTGAATAGTVILQSLGDLNFNGVGSGIIEIGAGNTTSVGLISSGTLTLPSTIGGLTDAPADRLLVRGVTDVVDNDGAPRELSFDASHLIFGSGSAGGTTVLHTNVGRLDATIGNGAMFTLDETNDITLGVVSTAGDLFIIAGGAIADDADTPATTWIEGNHVVLSGASIGAAGNELDTAATTLSLTASAGGAYVREQNAVLLNADATGAIDVSAAGALTVAGSNGAGIRLTGTTLTLNGVVDGNNGAVNLTASGDIIAGAGHHVSAGALTATGANIGTDLAQLETTVVSLTANSLGTIYVNETDSLSLTATAGADIDVETGDLGSINIIGTVATPGDVRLTAGTPVGFGAITSQGGQINADTLTATSSSIGTAGARLRTSVTSLNATTTGDVWINETNDIALTTNVGGNLVVTAAGAILGGTASDVRATNASLFASAIGTSGARLNTTVGTLDASASNGGIFVSEADALGFGARATNGTVDVQTANGTLDVFFALGDGVTLATAGDGNGITLNTVSGPFNGIDGRAGDVTLSTSGADSTIRLDSSVRSTGDISLVATGDRSNVLVASEVSTPGDLQIIAGSAANGGNIQVGGVGGLLEADTITLTGGSIGQSGLSALTAANTVNATSTNGGIFIAERDDLELNANASGGGVDVITGGSLTVASLTSGGAIALETMSDNSALTINQSLDAGTGGIRLATRGNDAAITTQSDLNGSFINISTVGANSSITLHDAASATAGITIAATGPGSGITLNSDVSTAGDVALIAGRDSARGAIDVAAGAHITGANLVTFSSSLGSASNRVNTTVGSLTATTTNGGVFVSETDGLTLEATATGGAVDVQTTAGALVVNDTTGADIRLASGGGVSVGGEVTAANDISIAANSGGIDLGNVLTARNVSLTASGAVTSGTNGRVAASALTAQGSSIGSAGSGLRTTIETLTANARSGDAHVSEQDSLTLADVRAAGNVGVTTSSGNITVRTVNAGNDATLTAGSGAISDDGDDTTRLTARNVTLSANSIGGPATRVGTTLDSKARLDLDAISLDATATNGGIYIDEANGLSSVKVRTTGGESADIELLTATGDLNLLSVNSGDTLLLAAGRDILALPGLGTITARAAELRAGGADSSAGHIGTLLSPLKLQLSAGSTLRMFVPQSVNPNDATRAPSTLPSAGVLSTLSLFNAPNLLSVQAGFGQFQGLSDSQFTSPAEALVRSIQNQTAVTQSVVGLDWASFDPNVSLFGTLDPSVCLPNDQRDEEEGQSGC